MSIEYLGSLKSKATLHLQAGAEWNSTGEGLDVLTEKYMGPLAAKYSFLITRKLGARHTKYPSLYLTEITEEVGRSFTAITLRWLGDKNPNEVPQPKLQRRTAVKTASATTTTPNVAVRDVTYVSPEIVWTYATDKEILSAQQSPVGTVPGFAEEILRDVITVESDGDNIRYPGSAPAGLVSALTMSAAWRLATLTSDAIKYTPYWTNQEVWAWEYPQGA